MATNIDVAIFSRVVDPLTARLSPESARALLVLNFAPADHDRMNELAAKARAGTLTASEDDELTNFIHVGHLLGLLHSKARCALQSANGPS